MISTRAIRAVVVAILLTPGTSLAQSEVQRIQLVEEDSFVVRSMKIMRKGGGEVPSIKMIASVDVAAGIMHAVDLFGRPREIALSDIDRIECAQAVRRQSPMAQEPSWIVEVHSGVPVTTTSPTLDVRDGVLTLSHLAEPDPSADLPQSGTSSDLEPVTWEARTIRYDGERGVFELALVPVRYQKRFTGTGGGGTSGGRKGIQ